MFRLLINIGGNFDLYVSNRAPRGLRFAQLPSLGVTGVVGEVFVERVRFSPNSDYGRSRYLLLLTERELGTQQRSKLTRALEDRLSAEFDKLIVAKNRDDVAVDCRNIFNVCEDLDLEGAWREEEGRVVNGPRENVSEAMYGKEMDSATPASSSGEGGEDGLLGRERGTEKAESTKELLGTRQGVSEGMSTRLGRAIFVGVCLTLGTALYAVVTGVDDAGREVVEIEIEESNTRYVVILDRLGETTRVLNKVEQRVGRLEERFSVYFDPVSGKIAEFSKVDIAGLQADVQQLQNSLATTDSTLSRINETLAQHMTGRTLGDVEERGERDFVQGIDASEVGILAVQWALKELGYYTGAVDGISGPNTERAIAEWLENAQNKEEMTTQSADERIRRLLNEASKSVGTSERRWGP